MSFCRNCFGVLHLLLLLAAISAYSSQDPEISSAKIFDCKSKSDSCVSCTQAGCAWCPSNGCQSKHDNHCDSGTSYFYDDTCPVYWPATPSFLPDWMGEMTDIIGNLTLLDISLPGTHDTLTYELSTTVSDGGADDYYKLAEILHKYEKIVPDGLEDWIRQQSQTQKLNITAQLDNGVRFIDFRQMYEYSDDNPEWYSLHFMQSMDTAISYFTQVRDWVNKHPKEIVVLWISKHGNTCAVGEDQYPKVSVESKNAFWNRITDVFHDLLTDFSMTKVNETSITDMVKRNHRVVLYVSDYVEFTGSSMYALDGCLVDNHCGTGISDEPGAMEYERNEYMTADATKAQNKPYQKFYLQSLSTGIPAKQTEKAAKIKWLPSTDADIQECVDAFGIPGMFWCPETLLDVAQLANYYKQITLDEVATNEGWGFPNAIYINALDWDGTVRTGTQTLWGGDREGSSEEHKTASYAYVDTLLLYNVYLGCGNRTDGSCGTVRSTIEQRKSLHPATYWDDEVYGRLTNWP